MAVSIRLSRGGSKKRPYYRIVVADARSSRDGKFIEKIGTYNPLLAKDDAKRVVLDSDRATYWLGVGAQPTDRVARFLDVAGVRERAARNNPNKGKPGEKATERVEEREKKLADAADAKVAADAAAAEAAAEAAAAPAPEPEPVAEEAPAADSNEEAEAVVAAEVEAATEEPTPEAEQVAEATAEQTPPVEANTATPDSDAGDETKTEGESAQAPAEG